MGKPTGFMEISRQDRRYRLVADRVQNYQEFVIPLSEDELKKQVRVAWIVESPIAITDARSTTSFLTGTIWFTKATGAKPSKSSIARITFPNSPAEFVRPLVRRPVR